jgi:putative ABC transport system permease protein
VLTRVAATPVGVLGVDFQEELRIKGYWHPAAGAMPDAAGEVLAGSQAAQLLRLAPGDPVTLLGRPFTVAGILAPTGADDDKMLFTDLPSLQQAAGAENKVHFVGVAALCSGCPIDEITAQIAAMLPGTDIKAMQQVVRSRMMTVDFVKRLAFSVSGVILLSACVMLGLSIFSSVNERKNEIGLLRALGYSKTAVFFLMDLEALLLGLVSALLGCTTGYAASFTLMALLDLGSAATPVLDWTQCALMVAGVTVLSALAALPPGPWPPPASSRPRRWSCCNGLDGGAISPGTPCRGPWKTTLCRVVTYHLNSPFAGGRGHDAPAGPGQHPGRRRHLPANHKERVPC